MPLLVVILLILVGLSGSEGIIGKKRAQVGNRKVAPHPVYLLGWLGGMKGCYFSIAHLGTFLAYNTLRTAQTYQNQ